MTVSLADAVELAADTIAEHPDRWIQNTYFVHRWGRSDAPSCACALGQIDLAAEVMGLDWAETYWGHSELRYIAGRLDLLDDIVHDLTGSHGVADHNDTPGRTAQQMAGLLREVADTLRAQAGAKQTTNNQKEK